eukprot:Nk52_evm6s913 gene=Nk52_evmTU6s913
MVQNCSDVIVNENHPTSEDRVVECLKVISQMPLEEEGEEEEEKGRGAVITKVVETLVRVLVGFSSVASREKGFVEGSTNSGVSTKGVVDGEGQLGYAAPRAYAVTEGAMALLQRLSRCSRWRGVLFAKGVCDACARYLYVWEGLESRDYPTCDSRLVSVIKILANVLVGHVNHRLWILREGVLQRLVERVVVELVEGDDDALNMCRVANSCVDPILYNSCGLLLNMTAELVDDAMGNGGEAEGDTSSAVVDEVLVRLLEMNVCEYLGKIIVTTGDAGVLYLSTMALGSLCEAVAARERQVGGVSVLMEQKVDDALTSALLCAWDVDEMAGGQGCEEQREDCIEQVLDTLECLLDASDGEGVGGSDKEKSESSTFIQLSLNETLVDGLMGILDDKAESAAESKKASFSEEVQTHAAKLVVMMLMCDSCMNKLFPLDDGSGDGSLRVKRLIEWLHSPHSDVRSTAAMAIGNMARSDGRCRNLVNNSHLMEVLKAMIQAHSLKEVHSASSVLRNLAMPPDNKPIIGSTYGMIPLLGPQLVHFQHYIQFTAISCIRLLTAGCSSNCDIVFGCVLDSDSGHCLYDEGLDPSDNPVQQLEDLRISSEKPSFRQISLPNNGKLMLDVITELCDSDHVGVRCESTRVLVNLIKYCTNESAILHIYMSGGVSKILELLASDHIILQGEAILSLAILASKNEMFVEYLTDCNGIHAVLKFARNCAHVELASNCAILLGKLVRVPRALEALRKDQSIALEAMENLHGLVPVHEVNLMSVCRDIRFQLEKEK